MNSQTGSKQAPRKENKNDRLVRASEIGLWGYCQRAWWLAMVKEVPHQNPAILQRGTVAHAQHGQTVRQAQFFQTLGLVLLSIALLIAGLILLFNLLVRV